MEKLYSSKTCLKIAGGGDAPSTPPLPGSAPAVRNKHVPLRTMTRKEKRLTLDNKKYSGFYQNEK